MFDRTTINHESKVVAITKEIEKTISPDKVTEMYDAVREEVENTIVRSYIVDSNMLKAVLLEVEPRYDRRTREGLLRFVLNGKEYIERFTLPETYTDAQKYQQVSDIYTGAIAKILAEQTFYLMEMPSFKTPSK